MKNKYLLGMAAFAMMALLGVSVVSAHGFGFGFSEDNEEMRANQEAMREAVENDDYDAWEELMLEWISDMEDSINEETFAEIQERHEARADLRDSDDEFGVNREGFRMERRGHGMKPVFEMAE